MRDKDLEGIRAKLSEKYPGIGVTSSYDDNFQSEIVTVGSTLERKHALSTYLMPLMHEAVFEELVDHMVDELRHGAAATFRLPAPTLTEEEIQAGVDAIDFRLGENGYTRQLVIYVLEASRKAANP